MHCQTETAQAILDAEADFILSVKDNQPTLHQYLLDKFQCFGEADFNVEGLRRLITNEKSHGRRERREYYVIAVSDEDKKPLEQWPGLKSVGIVIRKRTIGDKEQMETSFFITIHEPKVRALAGHIRGHWSIENSQHHVLDVIFAEDASRIRRGTAPFFLLLLIPSQEVRGGLYLLKPAKGTRNFTTPYSLSTCIKSLSTKYARMFTQRVLFGEGFGLSKCRGRQMEPESS